MFCKRLNGNSQFIFLNCFVLLILLFMCCSCTTVRQDSIENFNFNWRFAKGEQKDAVGQAFDDSKWEKVDLPHDWAISGPFGRPEANGNTGKLPWKGQGCYRKEFTLSKSAKDKRVILVFDGVMASPTVYLNGKEVGGWVYGYNSFHIDATEAANIPGKNVLTIHVDTRQHKSRWYPGAGIYRKVTLRLADKVHIPVWGVFVTTPDVNDDSARVNVKVEVSNKSEKSQMVRVLYALINPAGKEVAASNIDVDVSAGKTITASVDMIVNDIQRWDIEHPHLYTAVTKLLVDGAERDKNETEFGIRTFKVTADDGFHLNGRRVQLKGVNLHHDHGPLGAAFFPRAMERQLQIMKDMGVNAIRTSHNMPAPELPQLCDRMGFIVFNEAFDKYGPTAGIDCSYQEYVDKYAKRELCNFIRRDRNHPSVFFWSVGNEVGEIDGENITAKMVKYVKKYDTTRNVSQGFHIIENAGADSTVLKHLDSSGWNYKQKYMTARKNFPEKPLIYTESASAFGTRGAYQLNLPEKNTDYSGNGECTAYILTSAKWSDIPDQEFDRMSKHPFVAGEFVWTGFDYLGEPTPYNAKDKSGRLARSSYFGIVDLAGLPKDSYYLYRSHWLENENTVHISPHWNWKGREGKSIPVFVYTNGDSAELFLNGKSLGLRYKNQPQNLFPNKYYDCLSTYRLIWPDVAFQPGQLKAVAYKNGKSIGEAIINTAGKPAKLRLTADRAVFAANGMDLVYVTIEMVDKDDNVCPRAMDSLSFSVEGPLTLMAVANGNQMGFDSLTDNKHPLFYGKAVAVLRSQLNRPGKAKLKVTVPDKSINSEIDIRISGLKFSGTK